MARVPVLKPLTGELAYVDEADFVAALQQGFTAPTPQQVAQEKLGQKYGGLEAKVGAAVTGALRGATLRFSDVALSALGAEEATKAYEQLEPEIALGAEVAGTVAPVLLTAGTAAPEAGASLAARIAARTPAALAARAGEAAVSRLGLTAAEGVAQTVGRTAAKYAVQAGVESAIQGAGQEAGRLALDNELNGEKIGQIAGAGLTSGAIGLGIGAGLGLLGGGTKSLIQRTQRTLQDIPPDGVRLSSWEKAKANAQKISASVRGADPVYAEEYAQRQATRKMGQDAEGRMAEKLGLQTAEPPTIISELKEPPEVPQRKIESSFAQHAKIDREAISEAEKITNKLASAEDEAVAAAEELVRLNKKADATVGIKFRQDLNDFIVGEELSDIGVRSSGIKSDVLIKGNVTPEQLAEQRLFARGALDELKLIVDNIEADSITYSKQPAKRLRNIVARVERNLDAAASLPAKEQSAEIYRIIDRELKSDVGKLTSSLDRSANTPELRATVDDLRKFYNIPQRGLENTKIWGPIGEIQAALNPNVTESIARKNAFRSDWYGSEIRRKNPADPWGVGLPLSEPSKIKSGVMESVTPMGSNKETTFNDYLDYKLGIYNIFSESGEFSKNPKLKQGIEGQRKRIERLKAHFKDLQADQRDINFENPTGTGASRTIDAATGGALRSIASSLLRPQFISGAFRAVETVAPSLTEAGGGTLPKIAMAPSAERTVGAIASSQVSKIDSKVAKATRAISGGAVDIAKRAPVVGAMMARYDDRSKRVKELSLQSDAVRQKLEQEMAWMGGRTPVAQKAAVDTALRQLDYLNQALPKGTAAPTPFAAPLPPTRQQVQGWMAKLRAVENPASILDDIAEGKLTVEAVDAVRTVYPETFRNIQAQMVERLAKLQAKGKAPAYAQRIQLGLLLGIPSDPTMTPEVMQAVQGSYASQPNAVREGAAGPAPRQGGKPPNIAEGFRSGSEETELTSGAQ